MSPTKTETERTLDELGAELADRFGSRSDSEREELLSKILADGAGVEAPRKHLARPTWRKAAAAAGIGVVAAVVVTLLLPAGEDGPFSPPSASAALHRLSLLQSAHKDESPPLKPGQFYYRSAEGYNNYGETWLSRKGTGGYRVKARADGRTLQRIGHKDAYPIELGNLDLTYDEMLDLPRDPAQLFRVVKRAALSGAQVEAYDGSLEDNQKIFRAIESFLIENPAPANVKASFYEVLANLDFIHLLGVAETEDGRKGVAVGMWFNGGPDTDEVVTAADGTVLNERDDLIFDRRTGDLIGERTVLNGDASSQAFQTGIVDRLDEVPEGVKPPGPLVAVHDK